MTVTEQELQEAMRQGFEAGLAAGRAEAFAQAEGSVDRVSVLEDRLDTQSQLFMTGIDINERIVADIQDEINLLWSMLELPWHKRLRRLSRVHALNFRSKVSSQ